MELRHPEPFGARWRAKWIWFERSRIVAETATRPVLVDPVDTVALLRRTVTLDHVPETVPARLWCDGRMILRVNGAEVLRGPVRSEPRSARYDVVDLAAHLQVGENVISIVARHFGTATSWWMPVPPTYSLGAGSVVFEALIGDGWVVSDRTWRAARGSAWTPVPVPGDVACLPLEHFDARAHPHGWDQPGFDDGDWSKAIEIAAVHAGGRRDPHPPGEPFGMLRPPVRLAQPTGATHLARLVEQRPLVASPAHPDPVRQVLADEAAASSDEAATRGGEDIGVTAHRYTFDLERIAAGVVQLDVHGAAPGTVVDLAAAEHLDADGNLAPLGQHAGLRYVCDERPEQRFESFDLIGTRHLHAVVRPPAGAPAPTVRLAIADRHRPRPPGASFECSDPTLQRIFEIGLRTVDLSALDAYVDCPTREQRAWTGDSVVHQMVDLVTNPDWSMAIWHPQLAAQARPDGMLAMAPASDFAADDRTIVPDWSLHWIRSVWNLYRYTGDRELLAELAPVAERTLRWFESFLGADGLLHDVTGWVLIDWSSVYSTGCSSALNALWARALEDFAEISRWLGNEGSARWAEGRYQSVRNAFDVFWDDARSVYVDHLLDGVRQRPAAQHGGAAALAAGLVPAPRQARVVQRLLDRSRLVRHSFVMDPVTAEGGSTGFVYMVTGYPSPEWDAEHEMVEAQPFFRYVLHDGLARAGRADLVADACRDWQVFVDAAETSWPECWTGGTRCHGWSSTPTRDLVVHTLGLTPAQPGYTAVRFAPALGDLEWVRATIPTPHGPITAEAHTDGTVRIESPVPVVGMN